MDDPAIVLCVAGVYLCIQGMGYIYIWAMYTCVQTCMEGGEQRMFSSAMFGI